MICIMAGEKKEKEIYRSLTFETDTVSTWLETLLTSKTISEYRLKL